MAGTLDWGVDGSLLKLGKSTTNSESRELTPKEPKQLLVQGLTARRDEHHSHYMQEPGIQGDRPSRRLLQPPGRVIVVTITPATLRKLL